MADRLGGAVIEALCVVARASMIPLFLREVYARHKVTLINYHDPDAGLFDKHLFFFKKHYSIICLNELYETLSSGDWASLPPKPLLITFDDGYAGNASLAPILQKHHVPVTIFVVSGVADTHRKFWFTLLTEPAGREVQERYVDVPDEIRRQRLKEDLGFTDEREYETGDALTADALKNLVRSGAVIGSHSASHPNLTRCEKEMALREMVDSKATLERLTGKPALHFAYPLGRWDARVAQWVRESGFNTARTITPGWATKHTDPYALPNFGVSDDASLNKAIIQVCGLWDALKTFLRRRSACDLELDRVRH